MPNDSVSSNRGMFLSQLFNWALYLVQICETPVFQENLDKPIPEGKIILNFNEAKMMGLRYDSGINRTI